MQGNVKWKLAHQHSHRLFLPARNLFHSLAHVTAIQIRYLSRHQVHQVYLAVYLGLQLVARGITLAHIPTSLGNAPRALTRMMEAGTLGARDYRMNNVRLRAFRDLSIHFAIHWA
jgi:hypothetical protein